MSVIYAPLKKNFMTLTDHKTNGNLISEDAEREKDKINKNKVHPAKKEKKEY